MGELSGDARTMIAIPAPAASRLTGAGAKAAAAANGAGATASSSEDQVAAMGSALISAEMVISWAAPASNSAVRRHGQLGGAREPLASRGLSACVLPIVIGAPSARVRK